MATAIKDAEHLIVLCHGLTATVHHVTSLSRALRDAHADAGVLVVESDANSGVFSSYFTTTLGVELGGAKLAAEIDGILRRHPSIRRLSLVGHSLGGLYCRAALAKLAPALELVNFVAFASPNAGSRNHLAVPGIEQLVTKFGIIGQTGKDIMLTDGDGPGGMPLLSHLADPRHPAFHALSRFKRRILFTCQYDDDKVPYASSALAGHPELLPQLADQGLVKCHFDRHAGQSVMSADWLQHSCTTQPSLFRGSGTTQQSRVASSATPSPTLVTDASCISMDAYPHIMRVYSQAAPHATAGDAMQLSDRLEVDFQPPPDGRSSGGTGDAGGQHQRCSGVPPRLPPAASTFISGSVAAVAGSAAQHPLGAGPWLAFSDPSVVGGHEHLIISCLRSLPWINVDVHFHEWPAFLLNHFRIVRARPALSSLGNDVLEFFARHVFEP